MKKQILALGDSITNGYDGYQDLRTTNYPRYLSQILNMAVTNYGVNNAMITRKIYGDLHQRSQETNFKPYNLVIIFYGTNDYGHRSESLDEVLTALKNNLKLIQKRSYKTKLMGVVPMNRYDHFKNAKHVNGIGNYDMESLQNGIKSTYEELNIPVLDWRVISPELVTDENYKETLNDAHLHPTKETYLKMADIIAKFIKENKLI